jgi:hypothetical protein
VPGVGSNEVKSGMSVGFFSGIVSAPSLVMACPGRFAARLHPSHPNIAS